MTTSFEYDEAKSQTNRDKHGIDFESAKTLWDDGSYIEIPTMALDEERRMVIGKIEGKYWSAIITYRNEGIRLISVRRSRKEEIVLYESL